MNPFRYLPVIAALAMAAPAIAHPKLVTSSPAANATTGKISTITLNYNETLLPALSGAELVMTGMPGMASHAPMPIGGLKTSVKGGKTLLVTLPRPLGAGTYEVRWHAVAADTHRITGAFAFRVK
jgi:methionine-rich copper-binding protein CopC